jgi:hypothetical protein
VRSPVDNVSCDHEQIIGDNGLPSGCRARRSNVTDLERRLGYAIAELHATRALANGDDYARALLREQLEREELSERSDIARGAE